MDDTTTKYTEERSLFWSNPMMIPFWGTIIRTDALLVQLWAQPLLGAVQPTPNMVMSDFAYKLC